MTSLIEAGDAPGSEKVTLQSCDSPKHTIHTLCSCNTTCSTQYVCVGEKKHTHTHMTLCLIYLCAIFLFHHIVISVSLSSFSQEFSPQRAKICDISPTTTMKWDVKAAMTSCSMPRGQI